MRSRETTKREKIIIGIIGVIISIIIFIIAYYFYKDVKIESDWIIAGIIIFALGIILASLALYFAIEPWIYNNFE